MKFLPRLPFTDSDHVPLFGSVFCSELSASAVHALFLSNSEFTQQDGRKKRTAKRLCVTNVTGLLLACFVVIFT